MRKILVFSSLLVFATAGYAQGQTQQPQSEQQAAAGQSSQQQQQQKQSIPYDFAASKLMGKSVSNAQGQEIGTIEDVVVSQQDKVSHAVIGVGGFLGIGERLVAIPFDKLQVQGDKVTFSEGSKQQLSQMPEFQYKEQQQQQQAQQQGQQQEQRQEQQADASQGRDQQADASQTGGLAPARQQQ